jgi:hypothetical protein
VNTSGSAATLTTPRAIYGNNFDGSAALTQIIASTYGGTGNGFTKFTGATTAEKTYTLPNSNATLLYDGGALGTPSGGTVTNLTGTASININGTVGATTASSGAFTTLSATGVTTVQAGTAALPAITTTGDTNTGIFFPAADTIAFAEGGVEAMRIDSSGNVGIGTSSVGGKLTVIGAAAGIAGYFSDSTNSSLAIATLSGGVTLGTDGGGSIHLATDGATAAKRKMSIDTAGVITSTLGGMQVISGTSVASTSGTSIDFTGIPSWVKRLTVMFNGVSTNGTSVVSLLLGTGATPTYATSGYLGTMFATIGTSNNAVINFTTAITTADTGAATWVRHGTYVFTNISGNNWTVVGSLANSDIARSNFTAGSIALGAALTAVRITTLGGTNTFDAGTINILYE